MPIKVENLTHEYMLGTPFRTTALNDISFEINDGEFVGLIGHTGSGKSTLIQHLNALLKPTNGRVLIDGLDISVAKGKVLKDLRSRVGLVFQYPEHQLFEETIYKDIAYGPKNFNLPKDEVDKCVSRAMELVGLDYEAFKERSPFEISGGQKRRVAIAGVLAVNPKILILDEPTAGLDPRGRSEILKKIKELHVTQKLTVILVSHNMDDVARLADRIIVMHKGKVALVGTPKEIFEKADWLEQHGMGLPQVTRIINMLREKGFDYPQDVYTVKYARDLILNSIKGDSNV